MEFDNFVAEDSPGWGVTSPKSGDIVRDAIKKEKVLKYAILLQYLPRSSIDRNAEKSSLTKKTFAVSAVRLLFYTPNVYALHSHAFQG